MALITYIQNFGHNNWQNLQNDPILSVRHNDPRECISRFEEIIRSSSQQNTGPR